MENKKKVLVTGKNSYIGNYFTDYCKDDFEIEKISMRGDEWKKTDFSRYDVVFDVAGIAHADVGKVTEEEKARYYAVNCDLTYELAEKAKAEGVKQFIFMSSAIVYGDSAPIGKRKVITRDTPVSPANFYGDSKVQAEKKIQPLDSDSFKVVILRPPMIYGKGSKGNYPVLSKMAQKLPVFPYVKNERSMLYVGNLAEFIKLVIRNEDRGIFWPQNAEYSNTSELVKLIAKTHGKKIALVKGATPGLKLMSKATGLVNKAFGSLSYDMAISDYKENYRKYDLAESIELTEKYNEIK